jgi:hypothetical protein
MHVENDCRKLEGSVNQGIFHEAPKIQSGKIETGYVYASSN